MRKLATLFLLLISFSLVFAGAVSAAPEVDVAVVDENGDPVITTTPGTKINVTANATTDEYLNDPAVLITVDPKSGLTFEEDKAVMIYDGDTFTNDPNDPFFYYDDYYKAWIWWVGWVYGDQYPDEKAQLFAPATVSDVGEINVNADYMEWDEQLDQPVLLATDSFTFLSVQAAAGQTVPMQDTGAPLAVAAFGLLGIIGGTVYGKLR